MYVCSIAGSLVLDMDYVEFFRVLGADGATYQPYQHFWGLRRIRFVGWYVGEDVRVMAGDNPTLAICQFDYIEIC